MTLKNKNRVRGVHIPHDLKIVSKIITIGRNAKGELVSDLGDKTYPFYGIISILANVIRNYCTIGYNKEAEFYNQTKGGVK